MKRVIMTGGTGMLGLALIRFLVEKQIEVTVLARSDSKRLVNLPQNEYVKVVSCDLSQLETLTLEGQYDTFFHFGWAGTFGNERNDMHLQNKNVKYTLDAVDLAKRCGCTTFLGAGSQAEFGRVEGKLSKDVPANPENGYGIAKLCAGQMSRIACQSVGIKHIWVRILSTYGPYDGKHTMVMSGIIKMLKGERPQYTKGEQMWDYLHCDDAARAFYLAAEKGKDGAVYCIGSGIVKPLKEYITIIRDAVDPGIEIGFGEIPYYDKQVMYLCADIQNLTEDTGFVPEITFEEGIKSTVDWCKREMNNEEN